MRSKFEQEKRNVAALSPLGWLNLFFFYQLHLRQNSDLESPIRNCVLCFAHNRHQEFPTFKLD